MHTTAINATNSRNAKIKLGNAGFQRLFDGDEPEGAMKLRMDGYDRSWTQMKHALDVCTFISCHYTPVWSLVSNLLPTLRTSLLKWIKLPLTRLTTSSPTLIYPQTCQQGKSTFIYCPTLTHHSILTDALLPRTISLPFHEIPTALVFAGNFAKPPRCAIQSLADPYGH